MMAADGMTPICSPQIYERHVERWKNCILVSRFLKIFACFSLSCKPLHEIQIILPNTLSYGQYLPYVPQYFHEYWTRMQITIQYGIP